MLKYKVGAEVLKFIGSFHETHSMGHFHWPCHGTLRITFITSFISYSTFAGSVTSMDGDNGAEDADGEISATSPLLVPTEKRYRSQENVATGFGSIAATSGSRLNLCHRPQRHLCVLNTDAANDSDTNSHCALIVADEGNRWKTKAPRSASAGGNSNNNYELQELQEFEKIKSSRNRNKIWLRRCVALWAKCEEKRELKFPFASTTLSSSSEQWRWKAKQK